MKNPKIKTCIVCGKQYKYCPHCEEYNPYETWRMIFCSENDQKIYHIFDDYRANNIDTKEAYKRLSACNLSNKDNFIDLVRPTINEILEKGKL